MLPHLADDSRLDEAIALFNREEFEGASDLMEELFCEAIAEERRVARVLLQLFVGMVHVDQNQLAPALERLRVGLEESVLVEDWMGIDGVSLSNDIERLVSQLGDRTPVSRFIVIRHRDSR